MQLEGTLALCRSYLATVDCRPGEMEASLELAERTGEINAYGLEFGRARVTTGPPTGRRSV